MNSVYFLVLNLGLRSIRAIAFDSNAQKVWQNWYPVETILGTDSVEQNPNEWWDLAKTLLKEALQNNQQLQNSDVYISVTSSSSCLVLVDSSGNTIGNSIIVSDKRAPFWDNDVRGMFFGIEKFHKREDFKRITHPAKKYPI